MWLKLWLMYCLFRRLALNECPSKATCHLARPSSLAKKLHVTVNQHITSSYITTTTTMNRRG
jgi:hypothetical protein